MIGEARIRELWERVDRERRHVIERLMHAPPTSAGAIARQLGRDGAAWLDELGARRAGISAEDVEELAQLVGATAVPNMAALAMHGALTGEQAILGGVGAGTGVGLLVGVDVALEAAANALNRAARELVDAGYLDDRQVAELIAGMLTGVDRSTVDSATHGRG